MKEIMYNLLIHFNQNQKFKNIFLIKLNSNF